MTEEDKSLGKKIDEYFSNHPCLKDLYQEHPLEFDGVARYFYAEGQLKGYQNTKAYKEKFVDKAIEWLDDNIWEYIDTGSHGHLEILKDVHFSKMYDDLRKAMEE